jgi:peptidoglycan hydrolase-like protein with peptidoglycan-binding domain
MAQWPLEQTGSTGEDVKTVQYLLGVHGATLTVDGDFGADTKAAVEHFQSAHGLTTDGVVGNLTWPGLIVEVKAGSTGPAVKAVQSQLHSEGSPLAVDGVFGPATDTAVRAFQGNLSLTVDGVVGPLTWNTIVIADATGPIENFDNLDPTQGQADSAARRR